MTTNENYINFEIDYYDADNIHGVSEFVIKIEQEKFFFKEVPEAVEQDEMDEEFYPLTIFESEESVILCYTSEDYGYHFHIDKL